MTVPVIITATREALSAVPMSFREACWNMGATKWQTIRTIVLPNSVSGILTGVILEIARAAGETAPILFTGAVYFSDVADSGIDKFIPYYLGDKFMALSMHLHVISTQITDMPREMQFGTAAVIIGMIFAVNSVSTLLRIHLRAVKKWKRQKNNQPITRMLLVPLPTPYQHSLLTSECQNPLLNSKTSPSVTTILLP